MGRDPVPLGPKLVLPGLAQSSLVALPVLDLDPLVDTGARVILRPWSGGGDIGEHPLDLLGEVMLIEWLIVKLRTELLVGPVEFLLADAPRRVWLACLLKEQPGGAGLPLKLLLRLPTALWLDKVPPFPQGSCPLHRPIEDATQLFGQLLLQVAVDPVLWDRGREGQDDEPSPESIASISKRGSNV